MQFAEFEQRLNRFGGNPTTPLMKGNEPRDGFAVSSDFDRLSSLDLGEELCEMDLRIVHADLLHDILQLWSILV